MKLLNEILGTKYPIIQGGMANIATGEFAAACSNAGALGLIGSGGMDADALRENIRHCRALLFFSLFYRREVCFSNKLGFTSVLYRATLMLHRVFFRTEGENCPLLPSKGVFSRVREYPLCFLRGALTPPRSLRAR